MISPLKFLSIPVLLISIMFIVVLQDRLLAIEVGIMALMVIAGYSLPKTKGWNVVAIILFTFTVVVALGGLMLYLPQWIGNAQLALQHISDPDTISTGTRKYFLVIHAGLISTLLVGIFTTISFAEARKWMM